MNTTPLHPHSKHGGMTHKDSGQASEEGRLDTPERFGQEATTLFVGLHSINPRDYRHDNCPRIVRRSYACPLTCCLEIPRKGAAHDRLRAGAHGTVTRHPSLCPSTTVGGQREDKDLLCLPSLLCGIPGNLDVKPNSSQRKVASTAAILRRPL
jgi:hypothetical protein